MFSHLLLLLCLITGSLGAVPCLCENQDLEVHRDSTAILKCGCLSKENSIEWSINGVLVTRCPSFSNEEKQETCTTLNNPYNISAKRTSASSSVLTVSSGSLSKLNNVSCAVPETEEQTTCKVDLIYPANESSCHVKVDTGRDTGRDTGGDTGTDTVSAHCSITKAYSANGRYRCDLYQVLQNETKSQLLSTTTIKTLSRDSEGDMRGECSITARVLRGGELKMLITPGGVEINLNGNDDPKDISTTFPQGHFHPGHIGLPTDLPDKDSTGPLELTTDHVTTSGNNDGGATKNTPDVADGDTTCTPNVAGWFAGGVCLGLLLATLIFCLRGRWQVQSQVANARPQGPCVPIVPRLPCLPRVHYVPVTRARGGVTGEDRKKKSKKPATTPVCTAPSSITTQERSEGSDPPVPAGIEPVRLATPGMPGIYWLRFRANKVVPQPLDV